MSKKVKFAVVGCGHIGKRHAEMISRNSDSELVALVDLKKPCDLGIEQFNVPFFSSIFDLMKSNIELDVINIATNEIFYSFSIINNEKGRK